MPDKKLALRVAGRIVLCYFDNYVGCRLRNSVKLRFSEKIDLRINHNLLFYVRNFNHINSFWRGTIIQNTAISFKTPALRLRSAHRFVGITRIYNYLVLNDLFVLIRGRTFREEKHFLIVMLVFIS